MSFLDTNDGGDFLPYMQWGSDAVRWSRKDGDAKVNFDPKQAVFDMDNLKVGWIKIEVGAVDKILVPYTDTPPAQPEETKVNQQGKTVKSYQRGFAVNVLFGKDSGTATDRLFEFSTSQKGSLMAMAELMKQYEAEKAANTGKLPVVEFAGHEHHKMGKGSTNAPVLKISSWVDRPEEFDAAPSNDTAPAPAASTSEF